MQVQPAHIDQLARAHDGRMILIDKDASTVAADLDAIDPTLKVRFAENGQPPFWVVFQETEKDGAVRHDIVFTQQAHETAFGTWSGLDQRIVDRIRQIDPQGRGGYDYARELERQSLRGAEERKRQRLAILEPLAELGAHALRKDLGVRYKGRTFVPREVPR